MDPPGNPTSREEATIEVPSTGGGPPKEGQEPQFPPGPNPELKDKDDSADGLVRTRFACGVAWGKPHAEQRTRRAPPASADCAQDTHPRFFFPHEHPLSPLLLPARAAQTQEDRELKERLELAVDRLKDPNAEVQKLAMELLKKEIRESTRCARLGGPPARPPSPPPALPRASLTPLRAPFPVPALSAP
jgi:hypothetical protein